MRLTLNPNPDTIGPDWIAMRILAFLELLQAHHRLTGADLADRLGVDERTVRRYAGRLADIGIPVVAERGRYGGYRLLPGYKLPPLMLTDDEAVAVVLGLVAGERLGLPGPAAARETALAKIQRVLPAGLRDRVTAVADALDVSPATNRALPPDTQVLLTLAKAARDRRRATITYRSWRGESTERDLDAYGLVWHAGKWYAVGHDHRRDALRTFRLDRITGVRPGETPFTVPAGFDAVAHLHRSLATVPYRHEVEVVLHTTLDEAAARIPPSAATLTGTDGAVVMVAHAERLDGMARMLAGLGWPFEIRRPDALRDAVADLADRLHEAVRRIA
jgi:predicted DNA-binding transcriptional regulator YafY